MTTPQLAVGQIWAGNDPSRAGRTLKIVDVLPNGAICEVMADRADPPPVRSSVGTRVAILKYRFRPTKTGYRLISEGTE